MRYDSLREARTGAVAFQYQVKGGGGQVRPNYYFNVCPLRDRHPPTLPRFAEHYTNCETRTKPFVTVLRR